MANVQYNTVVEWDIAMTDVGYADADNGTVLKGLAINGLKITTGAPAVVPMHWLPGALVQNIIDGTQYINTGSTASPVWSLVDNSGGIGQAAIQFEDETGSNLGTSGTVNEFEITGPSVSANRIGNKVTYTVGAPGPTPSPYDLGVAGAYNTMSGTALTLTLNTGQLFTTGNIGYGSIAGLGTPSYGTGALDNAGLAAGEAARLSLYNTLKALSGTSIITPSAIEGDNYGYGTEIGR